MKKQLLLVAMALFSLTNGYAQEEGDDPVQEIVYTKSLQSSIDDAKSLVASSHYTTGQTALQSAISTAETTLPTLETNAAVLDAMKALQSAINEFIEANGHADATEKVLNNSFDKDNNNSKTITSWTVQNFKQNRRSVSYSTTRSGYAISNFAEQWVAAASGPLAGTGNMSQVVTGLPAGHYRLTADIFAHNQKYDETCEEAVGIQLYANDVVREVGMTGITDADGATFSLDFDVAEGENPTIGFRFENTNVNWLGWDNVTLLYIGDPDAYNSIVDAEKLAAIKETLATTLAEANNALASEDAPFYRTELQATITDVTALLETGTLDELTAAKERLDADLKAFKDYNKHYTNLKTAIENAEALIAGGVMTAGIDQFQAAINDAKSKMAQAATDYAADAEGGVAFVDAAIEELKKAENTFRVQNASYANPANVITNGGMSTMDGWDVLDGGTKNPSLHINTSGNVTNFSKPFMECWVASTSGYGQANYARQTVNALPNGVELPKGYYVLKAAALATRQGQPDVKVSGVTLRFGEQEVPVQTADGVANIYMIGFDKAEAGGELSFGLYIDENTDANWIAWDEVELQFVGDKDKYLADYAEAVLGESLEALRVALEAANKAIEEVNMEGVDFEDTDLYLYMQDAEYVLGDPVGSQYTKEAVDVLVEQLYRSINEFYTSGVSPKEGQSFDFTSMIKNANFDVEPGTEWTVETENGVLPGGTDCANWWFGSSGPSELTQEFSQTIASLPAGNYLLDVNAAVRVDMSYSIDGYTAENLPNNLTLCKVYANNDSADVHPFFYEDEALGLTLEKMLLMTNDDDYRHGNGSLINDMLKGTDYYHSYVPFKLEERGNVKIGFRIELPKKNGQMPFIDYFHLFYYGKNEINTGITDVTKSNENQIMSAGIYNMKGQLVRSTLSTKGLTKGLYIIGGKKVVIK
jgi:hypothetical protein